MTYIELKEKLDQMSEEQLKQQITFKGGGICGSVIQIEPAKENWFCNDWGHPGMSLDSESRLVSERQDDKKDWGEDDWNIYQNWYSHLEKTGSILKKGDVFLEVKEDPRTEHKKVYFHNVSEV